jgi:hypothetical protein
VTNRINVHVARNFLGRGFEFHIVGLDLERRETSLARPVEFAVVPENTQFTEPAFSLREEEAQRLMDELWNAGVRPTEGAGTAGSMAAVKSHLEDMRRIVFGALRQNGTLAEDKAGKA